MTDLTYPNKMPGRSSKPHDTSDRIVLKAIHDKSGWRVQVHLHNDGRCAILEGHARFPDERTCHEHGRMLHEAIDTVLGITPHQKPSRQGAN